MLPLPGSFLWYAVRGFFENGGQVCYVVRASNGKYATAQLKDLAGNNIIDVTAGQPGSAVDGIKVAVTGVKRLLKTTTKLYQPTGNYTVTGPRSIQLANAAEAAQFRPGDWVNLGTAGARLQILGVSGDKLRLASAVNAAVGANAVIRLADAPAGAQVFRIESTAPAILSDVLVPGAVLTIGEGATAVSQVVASVQSEPQPGSPPAGGSPTGPVTPLTTYRVSFREGLTIPISLDPANIVPVESEEVNVTVSQGGTAEPVYENLSIDPAHPRYLLNVINNASSLVQFALVEPAPATLPPKNLPEDTAAPVSLANGANEDLTTLGAQDYIDALDTLKKYTDVNLIAIPDAVTLRTAAPTSAPDFAGIATVQQAIIAHCELLGDRFGVLDSEPGLELFGAGRRGVDQQRNGLDSARGYAALYFPWLSALPVGGGDPLLVPPSGAVCGVIANTDIKRGVFKAPAGIECTVNGAVGVERTMSDFEQGQLNMLGINVVRIFRSGGRPVVWGARTTATDTNWQYVNIRRLFLFLEKSIQAGIRWAVFEPNTPALWKSLDRTIRAFLREQWRDGALFGTKEEEAFYVRIDDVLNPPTQRALGRLTIEIGICPAYPAEFIIVRIGIWQGDSQVTEV
jgi:hypothetical protein